MGHWPSRCTSSSSPHDGGPSSSSPTTMNRACHTRSWSSTDISRLFCPHAHAPAIPPPLLPTPFCASHGPGDRPRPNQEPTPWEAGGGGGRGGGRYRRKRSFVEGGGGGDCQQIFLSLVLSIAKFFLPHGSWRVDGRKRFFYALAITLSLFFSVMGSAPPPVAPFIAHKSLQYFFPE